MSSELQRKLQRIVVSSHSVWSNHWPLLIAIGIGAVAITLHTLSYLPYFSDDAFISLRYADRFRRGLGLTWNDSERVEGASNFLWVLTIGLIGFVKQDLVQVGRGLALTCTIASMAMLAWAVRDREMLGRLCPLCSVVPSLFVIVALSALGPVAAWTAGGLEPPMVLAGLGAAIVFSYAMMEKPQSSWLLSISLGVSLAALGATRPDATLFTPAFCGGLVLAGGFRKHAWKNAVVAGAVSTIAYGGLSLFRKLYYGHWFPNTSFKLFSSGFRYEDGWEYISRDYQLWLPLLFTAVIAILLSFSVPRVRKRLAVLLPALFLWLTYIALIRGDHMPQRRHLVPAFFIVVAIAAEVIRQLAAQRGASRHVAWYWAGAVCAMLIVLQLDDQEFGAANRSEWTWEGKPVGLFFRDVFHEQNPLMAVDAAGALPYHAGFETIDMLGLNDAYLASHPPQIVGKGLVGHELGDGAYVLRRKPDLVVFHLTFGRETPMWRGGWEMYRTSEWRKNYQRFYFTAYRQPVPGLAYIRHTEGALAPKWDGNSIQLPLWLLATSPQVRGVIDEKKVFYLNVRYDGKSSYTTSFVVQPGSYSISLNATSNVTLTVKEHDVHDEKLKLTGNQYDTLQVRHARRVRFDLEGRDQQGQLFGVRLQKLPL